ncbi:MAG: MTH1187 family thiamine-binding protein [Chloroflexota bacterium]
MKEQVIAEVSVVPIGTETPDVSKYVARCLTILKEAKDITFHVTAMSTIIQGPLVRVLALYQVMHEVPFEMGSKRVLTMLKIDDRRDKLATIESKVKAVS